MASVLRSERSGRRLRALVLAAGHGRRLRPLTETVPKPLLPVLGREVAERTLSELAAVGCEAVAMNLHHLGDAIAERFGERFRPAGAGSGDGMAVHYSREPELLGTLGALAPLADFLAPADELLIINGDSLCRWPLAALVKRHRKRGAGATFLLARRAAPEDFGGGVGVGPKGRLVSFRQDGPCCAPAERRYVFAGAHVANPRWFDAVEAQPSDLVRQLYEPRMMDGEPLATLVTGRRWHDLGTPGRYRRALLDTARRGSWVSPDAVVDADARIQRSVIEAGAVVEAGATVERSVLLPGARVGRGARLSDGLLSFGARLPAGGAVDGRLIWTLRDGATLGPQDTLLGELAYRPLD
jgi:mannose-1-phosphate guanylyltransferase